jgi:ABC-type branched-subunit amino acid transport system permease subunit
MKGHRLSTFQGLPAHVLLVHFVVVLAPLTAGLAIVCAVWPAARRRLTWLVLILALTTAVVTPLTTQAGEWLEHRTHPTSLLKAHTELGDTMLYFSISLVVAAALLVFVHLREARQRPLSRIVISAIAAVVVIASVATAAQVYRIGDSGARSAWGNKAGTASGE